MVITEDSDVTKIIEDDYKQILKVTDALEDDSGDIDDDTRT